MAETPEEKKERLRAQLARGREKAAANRAAKAAEPEPVAVDVPSADDPQLDGFDEFVLTLDPEARKILSDAQLMAIYSAAQARADEEKKKAAEKRAMERALGAARSQKGLVPAEKADRLEWQRRMAEMVTFTPDLPELGDIGLRIDGQIYLHGREVTVTRAQQDSYRDIVWRARQAELDFEGKGRLSHLRRQIAGLDRNLAGQIV